jgi:hypothetical protein
MPKLFGECITGGADEVRDDPTKTLVGGRPVRLELGLTDDERNVLAFSLARFLRAPSHFSLSWHGGDFEACGLIGHICQNSDKSVNALDMLRGLSRDELVKLLGELLAGDRVPA